MKKPKKGKYPNKPKHSSSNQVKENYLDRVKEIDKKHVDAMKDYNSEMKKKEILDKKIQSVKR